MKKLFLIIAFTLSLSAGDIILKESGCSVNATVANIKTILKNKGLRIFATINHQSNAKMVHMKLSDSKLIVFGNPKLGTAFMQQDITIGLDLPLKILVFRNDEGRVMMAYRDGTWLKSQHKLKADKQVAKMNSALDKITTKAGQCKRD
ncbi:DUF302 domain-containing protein [Sulfurimonas sp.]